MASEDEWRLCVEWLIRCNVLPSDHEFTQQDAEVVSLAQNLRDGVLLCHLLNVLAPDCIDPKDFSPRPQMSQFLCLKNIRAFLQTCKSKFGLKEGELFDSYELFDMRNFGKVINTLSKLSKTPHVLQKIGHGFPINEELQFHHDYKNLEDLMKDIQDITIYDRDDDDDEEEDIYDTIVCGGTTKGQAAALPPSPTAPAKSKRDFCIKELVETENNYVDALNMIITHFLRPLRNVLPQIDREIVFKYVEDLAQVHTGFHSELHKACAAPTQSTPASPKISDCFLKWKTKFLIYSDFCSHLPDAQTHIEEVSKNELIKQSILECQRNAKDGKFRLRDLLLVPMQRVLKYHLLLKELIKHTDPDQDKDGLQKALEAMEDLSAYVNEVKRDNERLLLIKEIQESITELTWPENTSLKDYGRLQKDGELRVRSHDDNRPKTRYVFLFDRVMLMCKAKMMDKFLGGEVYSYKTCYILSNYKMEVHNIPTNKTRIEKWSHPFLLVEKNQTNVITFLTKTDDQRDAWVCALQMALENNQPPGYRENGHDFVMHTFDKPTECSICKRLLRGIFFQGYNCKNTDMNVHKECIRRGEILRNGAPLPVSAGPGNIPPRPPVGPPPVPSSKQAIGKVKAVRNYRGNPAPPNDQSPLFFENTDVLELLQRSNDWFEGRKGNVEGWFPRSFVKDLRQPGVDYLDVKPPEHLPLPPGIEGGGRPPPLPPGNVRPPQPPPPGQRTTSCLDVNNDINHVDNRPPKQLPLPPQPFPEDSWFVGPMSREDADKALDHHPCGTFLIRESTNQNRKGQHALSIKYGGQAKHIRVFKNKDQYYIADIKYFKSIPELVDFYQHNSLSDSFTELNTTLVLPMKESQRRVAPKNTIKGYATASFDFAATAVNQLSLKRGDKVAIISKMGGDKGWWKGQLNGKIGYFPCAYVKEDEVHVEDDCD
ncbi:guanine nucleotide exchange factor VAV3-like isoform X3 [Lineus longissimus]|uniref:guanine nucleotide exchange factor VAV3-like isoform X3 n=1 Tax=Lineus longissimus TaxID=88925 RepID=UPI00315C8067